MKKNNYICRVQWDVGDPIIKKTFARWVCVYSYYRKSDGLFLFMYTTETKIKNGFAVVKVYENKEYWHTYEFPIQNNYNFIDHISGKVWGTVGVLSEIKNALKDYNNERMG